MALSFGISRNLEYKKFEEILKNLENLDLKLEEILENKDSIKSVAEKYANYKNMFFLGRNLLYPIAMEGSLKLKEITYNHSEAYSA
jgi:glucosamine--fructose-6-phosphate aminotransferase (isomerizing)